MEDTIRVATPLPDTPSEDADKLVHDGVDALDLQWSIKKLKTPRTARHRKSERLQTPSTRSSSRLASRMDEPLVNKLSQLGRKGRKAMEKGSVRMSRELRRLQDTKEFAHIDDELVVHTVWSKGKLVVEKGPEKTWPTRKRAKTEEVATKDEEKQEESRLIIASKGRRAKKYLDRGLYAGQDLPLHITMGLTNAEKKKLSQIPELSRPAPPNKILPLPIFNGMRLLLNGRDFKLPFNICNPLPPGQPKPDEWRKMTKNRFIGDSLYYWKKSPYLSDLSTCVCTPEDGCGEDCQNRIMLYECDDVNCNVGKEHCTNRAFASLMERKAKGGKYRIGVEVVKTADRGYGVRSNRCFEAGQIIMEYTGEIITEEECDRRMNEIYKDNEVSLSRHRWKLLDATDIVKCYYLMSFDQNMIIDATTGSIARFVNHSCNPNCRMIKWIVAGQPRMALFAGDKPIMTGEELTYDYNFDPFSAKNVQKCLCGEKNCRGVLGPKPKEVKPKDVVRTSPVKNSLKAGKRKLKELTDGDDNEAKPAKKRKVKPTLKRSLSDASLKVTKGTAKGSKAVKRRVSTLSLNTKTTPGSKRTAAKQQPRVRRRASTGGILKSPVTKRRGSGQIRKTHGKSPRRSPQSRSHGTNLLLAKEKEEEAEGAKKFTATARKILTAKGARNRVSASASKVMKKRESPYERTYTSTGLKRRVMEALDDNAKATKRPRLAKTGTLTSLSPRNGSCLERR